MKWYYTIVYYIINLSSITSHVVLYGYMLVLFQQLMGLNMRINVLLLVHGLCSVGMTDRPLNTLTYCTIVRVSPYPSLVVQQVLAFSRCQELQMNLHVLCICTISVVALSSLQWPQLPLTSWQSRKVPLVSESLGPHPLHWGIQLGTGSTIMVAAVAVWMLVVAPQTTTY